MIDFIKSVWEWLLFIGSAVLAWLAFRDTAPPPPTRTEPTARQEDAEAKKQKAKRKLQRLREKQKVIEAARQATGIEPEELDIEELKQWYENQYSSDS